VTLPFAIVCHSSDRDRWLAERRKGVGASESAAILGQQPPSWSSAYELWAIKTGRAPEKELDDLEYVFWGSELEPAIISGYGKRTQRTVVPFGLMLRSTRWPWMTATPDALVSESATANDASRMAQLVTESIAGHDILHEMAENVATCGWWPLQTKNIGFGSADHWANGLPAYYAIQCIHEALVFGAGKVTGAALIAGQRLAWDDITVNLEGTLERQIVNLTKRFMADHVEADVAPAPDHSESSKRALVAVFPLEQPGKKVVLGATAMDRAYELERAKEQLKAAEVEAKRLENLIRAEMGDAEVAIYPDGSAHTLKSQTRGGSTFRVLRRKEAREAG
jgi:predicted phage-related endonuclease